MASESASDLHNRIGPDIVTAIVGPVVRRGGDILEAMVLVESITLGVLVAFNRLQGVSHEDLAAYAGAVGDAVGERILLDGKPAGRV